MTAERLREIRARIVVLRDELNTLACEEDDIIVTLVEQSLSFIGVSQDKVVVDTSGMLGVCGDVRNLSGYHIFRDWRPDTLCLFCNSLGEQ